MKFPSHRWLAPALGLMLLTAVFTLSARFLPRRVDPCADPGRLLDPVALDASSRPFEGQTWRPLVGGRGMRKGELGSRRGRFASYEFLIRRDWGLPLDFQNPGKGLPHHVEADRLELRHIEEDGASLPVHYAFQVIGGATHFALYVFFYDGSPVAGMFTTRLRHLVDELVHGSRPATLFLIAGRSDPLSLEENEARAQSWIRAAWHHYRNACNL